MIAAASTALADRHAGYRISSSGCDHAKGHRELPSACPSRGSLGLGWRLQHVQCLGGAGGWSS